MGCHEDGNVFPMQLTIRFGDAVGAELRSQGGSVRNGVFLMDSNAPHSVSQCEAGVRYSIVTYIKKDAVALADWHTIRTLSPWVFPVQCLPLLHALLLLAGRMAPNEAAMVLKADRPGACTGQTAPVATSPPS